MARARECFGVDMANLVVVRTKTESKQATRATTVIQQNYSASTLGKSLWGAATVAATGMVAVCGPLGAKVVATVVVAGGGTRCCCSCSCCCRCGCSCGYGYRYGCRLR